ncbi:MAG TPA: TRAM domain-containing protein [Thermoanaerobaculia bacterium]|nr:TRAM domain-containing protein [Thermoanaerobaculia bacterium]
MTVHDDPPPRRSRASVLAQLEETELVIEKLVQGGEGLGRVAGVPVLVPRVAPGDRVLVRIVERRPDYGRAEVVELLEPGPGRRPPPCPVFDRCGGCDLQHLEDELQTRLKVEAAREALQRLGGVIVPKQARVVRGAAWGYRLRTQVHAERSEREEGSERVAIGYRERRSDRLVETVQCPILEPRLEAVLPRLQQVLAEMDDPPRRIDLAAAADRLSFAPSIPGLHNEELEIAIGGHRYRFDARSFFQAHRDLVADLVEVAVGAWEDQEGAAFDLYAGVGLFAIPLATRYRTVVAVEGDRVAARYARINARRNRIANLEIEHRTVERFVESLPDEPARVVVDPPRRGLAERVRRELLRSRARRLTYVSCQPATLARDLRELGDRYELENVVFLDLFPQSAHLETVVQLVLRD